MHRVFGLGDTVHHPACTPTMRRTSQRKRGRDCARVPEVVQGPCGSPRAIAHSIAARPTALGHCLCMGEGRCRRRRGWRQVEVSVRSCENELEDHGWRDGMRADPLSDNQDKWTIPGRADQARSFGGSRRSPHAIPRAGSMFFTEHALRLENDPNRGSLHLRPER